MREEDKARVSGLGSDSHVILDVNRVSFLNFTGEILQYVDCDIGKPLGIFLLYCVDCA